MGDDLRQDAIVMQLIGLMDQLWRREGLDLNLLTFKIVATGACRVAYRGNRPSPIRSVDRDFRLNLMHI